MPKLKKVRFICNDCGSVFWKVFKGLGGLTCSHCGSHDIFYGV